MPIIRLCLIENIFVLKEFGMNAIVITITQLVVQTIVMILCSLYCSIVRLVMFRNINKRRFH